MTIDIDLWVEPDTTIGRNEELNCVTIADDRIETTIWFRDWDRPTTDGSVKKIDELTEALAEIRKSLMADLDNATFAEAKR